MEKNNNNSPQFSKQEWERWFRECPEWAAIRSHLQGRDDQLNRRLRTLAGEPSALLLQLGLCQGELRALDYVLNPERMEAEISLQS